MNHTILLSRRRSIGRMAFLVALGVLMSDVVQTAEAVRYKIAMVALVEDRQARADFEEGLAARFRANNYDAVTSYDIIPEADDLDDADAVRRLSEAGIQAVLMMKLAAVGPGSSLESVRGEVSDEVYANMRSFAREISPSHSEDELVAVIHSAIYVIGDEGTELLSSGAVWLDEPVETQEEGIEKLQDLIVTNMNKARPAIRQYLGLPPLTES